MALIGSHPSIARNSSLISAINEEPNTEDEDLMLPETMTVIEARGHGDADVLEPGTRPMPQPGANDVLIAVEAAGINRPDVLQRQGLYPPPKGASDLLGLEVAGPIVVVGENVTRFKPGDFVCALVNGGGYAEYAVAPEATTLLAPQGVNPIEAAALPETGSWFMVGRAASARPPSSSAPRSAPRSS